MRGSWSRGPPRWIGRSTLRSGRRPAHCACPVAERGGFPRPRPGQPPPLAEDRSMAAAVATEDGADMHTTTSDIRDRAARRVEVRPLAPGDREALAQAFSRLG